MAYNKNIKENALFIIAKQKIPIDFFITQRIINKDLNVLNFY